ncbi:MAG: hypothetical protein JWO30_658 [Fibrobacteres bacterium]|nr:hypothetical protein [Fibrobacterota bacterium]
MKFTTAALAVAGTLFLASCENPPLSGQPDKVWYGLISNSCGPADGPAVSISLDTAAYAACGTYHQGQYGIYSEAPSVDSIHIGKVITSSGATFCDGMEKSSGAKCGDRLNYRLEIERVDATRMQAAFRIEIISAIKDTTVKTGTVILTKCLERPLCG